VALLVHPGTGSTDLGARYVARDDISEYLLASLQAENNMLGLIPVGPEFVGDQLNWLVDSLNKRYVTDNTAGGLTSSQTNMTVATQSDAGVLAVGAVLIDETAGNLYNGEQIQVTAIAGTTLTILRGYGSTTAATHTNGAIWRIVNLPIPEGSGLGPDQSRARSPKYNIINRWDMNVTITQEQLTRARRGFAPGLTSELRYQFEQRLSERRIDMNRALIYSRPAAGGAVLGDNATMAGIISFLDGTWDTNAVPINAAGAVLTDTAIFGYNKTIIRNGAVPDWLAMGTNGVESVQKLYKDQIRLEQDDDVRGTEVRYLTTTMANSLRLLWDNSIYDNTTSTNVAGSANGLLFLLDSGRIRIRPAAEAFFYIITAPTFTDGDSVRALSKWSLEMRNVGSDVGAASQLVYGLNF
jgi:hypothetical protein